MITREQIIAEARTWIGTPWVHTGRLKGIACDCIGVGLCVPRALGIFPADFDVTGYSRNPEPRILLGYLRQYMDRTDHPTGGDLLLVRPYRLPQHIQMLTFDGTVIHAIDRQRGVREHRIDVNRYPIASAWKYRGVN